MDVGKTIITPVSTTFTLPGRLPTIETVPTLEPVPTKVVANLTVTEAKTLTDVNSSGIGVLADTAMGLANKPSTTNPAIDPIRSEYEEFLSRYERDLCRIRNDLGEKALREIKTRMDDITQVLIAIETHVKEIPKCRQIKVAANCRVELAELLKNRFGVSYVKLEPDMTDKSMFIITFGPSIDDEIKQCSDRLNKLNEMKMRRAADEAAASKRPRKE